MKFKEVTVENVLNAKLDFLFEGKSTTRLHYGPAGAVGQKNWERIKKAAVYRSRLRDDPQHFPQLSYYDDASDSAKPLPVKLDKEQVVALYNLLRDMFRADQSNVDRAYMKLATLRGISDLLSKAMSTVQEGEVLRFKRSKPVKQQYGTRVFPPKQRNVDKPEGNVTPIKNKLDEEIDPDYYTAQQLAREMYQDIQDLVEITQSGSNIAAGNPHNVESLRTSIQELDQEITNLGYHYDPMAKDLITPIKG